MALASLERLGYRYPDAPGWALEGVALELGAGLLVAAGPSGGGKSTLLRCLNGLVPHFHGGTFRGTGWVRGLPLPGTPTRRLAREVGFVFQDPESQGVYGVVEREIAFGLENLGWARPRMVDRVDQVLARLGLEKLRGRRLPTLSGGERQRVALASALALEPAILVLDEPTSQLDPAGAAALVEACSELAAGGRAVLFSEHRLDRILPAAMGLVLLDSGRLIGPAAPRELAHLLPALRRRERAPRSGGEEMWRLERVAAGPARRPVLEGIDLCGRRGQVTVVMGPNGSGKTTLLRTLAGLVPLRAGTREIRPGRIAYLPQNPQDVLQLPTVRGEVDLTLRRSGETGEAGPLLARLGLSHLAERYPRDLSTGERQRAAIAAILAGRPALALLDEPTRGMDVPARSALIDLVDELAGAGTSLVLATHDEGLAAAVADRYVDLPSGKVRSAGAPNREPARAREQT